MSVTLTSSGLTFSADSTSLNSIPNSISIPIGTIIIANMDMSYDRTHYIFGESVPGYSMFYYADIQPDYNNDPSQWFGNDRNEGGDYSSWTKVLPGPGNGPLGDTGTTSRTYYYAATGPVQPYGYEIPPGTYRLLTPVHRTYYNLNGTNTSTYRVYGLFVRVA